MSPGLSDDLQQVNHTRKTAIINRELAKQNIDITAFQETHLAASGSLKGKEVGISECNSILSSMQPPSQGTELIISLLLNTFSGPTHIFSAYAPTLSSSPEVRVSWTHPTSKHWLQLDLVITRKSMLNHVSLMRSYHSDDCDTDHSLVGNMVRLHPRQFYCSKQKGCFCFDTSRVKNQELREQFSKVIDKVLEKCPTDSAQTRWDFIHGAKYKAAIDTFGKRANKNEDWFEAGIDSLDPAITAKGKAQFKYQRQPSAKNLAIYRKAHSNAKSVSQMCANNYWLRLDGDIQSAADSGNTRVIYKGMKKAFHPSITKVATLKFTSGEIIKDSSKQMES
ncbi:hypothetical protein RRG08_017498 [Elysia crispata]|uniref:Uncharacterized protein n=1 Tax=Elysia crispata TaxID=231223 RepID=A0AAE1DXP5_9GAST|nr:hypothetical protein RRG08_017498 [Elysia crispata]